MNKKNVKIIAELIGLQFFFGLLSLFFFYFFTWANPIVYSAFTAWLFLGASYSTLWQLGRKDAKAIKIQNNHLDENQSPYKQKMVTGFCIGACVFVFSCLVSVLELFVLKDSGIMYGIQLLFVSAFQGFYQVFHGNSSVFMSISFYLIVYAVIWMFSILGYITGAHGFSMTEKYFPKILYKKKK